MKTSYLLLVSLAFLFSGCGVTSSQSGGDKKAAKKERRAEEFNSIASLVESGNYVYKVQSVNTNRGKTMQTTSRYSMKASNGNFRANLPYFGRAYQANMSGNGGIAFDGSPEDLTISKDTDKLTITTNFAITNSGENYNVTLVIGSNGYGSLMVSSQQRDAISYYGYISSEDEKSKLK